ncbi:MAG TPA: methyltransferase domain-containing protein [Chitinophagales bacterium]|nr:methyltransferase domain-containing protein [Chitinophagales bacterium]
MLDANFWNQRYLSDNTGWDLGEVSPPLKTFIDQLENKAIKILIPGCGNAHEAEYLLQKGFTNITVVDISEVAVKRLQKKFAGNNFIKIVNADFFAHDGIYDLIFEQTFFCALHPSERENYVKKMYNLLAPAGKLVGVLFNVEFDKDGPPFGGDENAYRKIFESYFRFKIFAPCYNSIGPRMGTELFMYLKKRGL